MAVPVAEVLTAINWEQKKTDTIKNEFCRNFEYIKKRPKPFTL